MNIGTNFYKDHLKNKTFSDILENYSTEIYSNEAAHKTISLTFIAKSTDAIVEAFNNHKKAMIRNSESNLKLSKNVFWLNIILGIFTIVGAVFGFLALIKP